MLIPVTFLLLAGGAVLGGPPAASSAQMDPEARPSAAVKVTHLVAVTSGEAHGTVEKRADERMEWVRESLADSGYFSRLVPAREDADLAVSVDILVDQRDVLVMRTLTVLTLSLVPMVWEDRHQIRLTVTAPRTGTAWTDETERTIRHGAGLLYVAKGIFVPAAKVEQGAYADMMDELLARIAAEGGLERPGTGLPPRP